MPPFSPRLRGSLIALTGTTAWAFTGVLMEVLLSRYPLGPLTLAFWRDLFLGLSLVVLLRVFRPAALRITRRDLPFFILYGFFGLAIFNGLWTYSVRFNGAAVAVVLGYSSPAFTIVLARLFFREPLSARKLVAAALSLAGCVFVAEAYRPEVWSVNFWGLLTGLGSGAAFAGFNLAGRWSAGRFPSSWTVTAYGFLFAAAALALTQIGGEPFSLGAAWDGWGLIAFMALGPSLLGFGLYTLSMRYLSAGAASLIAALEPALTALFAIPILGRGFSAWQWLGAGLTLLAVILAQAEPARVSGEQAPALPAN